MNEFERRVAETDETCLYATAVGILQVNLGLRCNMSCAHCHQSCSPARTERMSLSTIAQVIRAAEVARPLLVDLTGGAPELHPYIRLLLTTLHGLEVPVQLRTNLTALLEPEASDVIGMMADQKVRVLASLHGVSPEWTFEPSGSQLRALTLLAEKGYGHDPLLKLDIAVNPAGPVMPTSTHDIETRLRESLTQRLGLPFNDVVVFTNMPVGRFREQLVRDGELEAYHSTLADAFNAATVPRLWCRNGVGIGWDGVLSDCDFNLGRGMSTHADAPQHVSDFTLPGVANRRIAFGDHCLACTAQAGSG